MKANYQFNIKNNRTVFILLMANAILLVNSMAIIYISTQVKLSKWQLILGLCGCLTIVVNKIFKRKDWLIIFIGSILVCVAWLAIGYWFIGIAQLLLTVFAKYVTEQKQVIFNTNSVVTKTMFGKTHQWNDLQNVVLKDGLLTIDFRNNQLLQVLIDPAINTNEELEFNHFCKSCLVNNG